MNQISNSYYIMFHILATAFYNGCGEEDCELPVVCGIMDPEGPFVDGPADMAIYYDWQEFVEHKCVSEENILDYTIAFLKQLDWNLQGTIRFLETSFTMEMIKEQLSLYRI